MEISQVVLSSQASAVSPDGAHVATFLNHRIEVRRISTLQIVRTVTVPANSQSRFLCLRWSPIIKGVGSSERFLYSDEDKTYVWDMQDSAWSAVIDNGTGGAGKIANVEFGNDDGEVLIFPSFGSKVTIWSLWTGKSVEIKDPKFSKRGYGRNGTGRNSIFAILTRPSTQDIVQLHTPGSYDLVKSFSLNTVDAQGLKWSPDGRWLATWEAPGTGYKISIYTADGNLFRTYTGDYFENELHGLGLKSLEWSPNGDFLAAAGFKSSISLLSTRTFSPAVKLAHLNTIKPSKTQIWQEIVSPSGRSYTRVTQPITPPGSSVTLDDALPRIGVSLLSFSADGTYLATRDDSKPSTCFIWDLSQLICCAVLVQHSVIRRLNWHPTDPNMLMIQCIQGESVFYTWNALEAGPLIHSLPSVSFSGKAEAQWVPKHAHRKPVVVYGDMHGFTLAYPDGKDLAGSPIFTGNQHEVVLSETADEDDSLFEALSQKKPANSSQKVTFGRTEDLETNDTFPDDTFQYRRDVSVQ